MERERLSPRIDAVEAPWTRSQTADFLKCHPDTVSDLIAAGEIQAYRLHDHPASHLRVLPASARAFVARRLVKA
jgi:hypothetical protein